MVIWWGKAVFAASGAFYIGGRCCILQAYSRNSAAASKRRIARRPVQVSVPSCHGPPRILRSTCYDYASAFSAIGFDSSHHVHVSPHHILARSSSSIFKLFVARLSAIFNNSSRPSPQHFVVGVLVGTLLVRHRGFPRQPSLRIPHYSSHLISSVTKSRYGSEAQSQDHRAIRVGDIF